MKKLPMKYAICTTVLMSAIMFHPAYLLAEEDMPYTQNSDMQVNVPAVQKSGDITYVTGGIGDEELGVLHSMKHNYNLHILSSAGASGAFPGNTHIVIYDKQGSELLSSDAGPVFYASIPTGHYVIEETADGQSKKQNVTIGGKKSADLNFHWNS